MNVLRANRFAWTGVIVSFAMAVTSAYATADGPDFYKLQSTPNAKPLALSADPPATPVVLNARPKPQTVTGTVQGYGTAAYRVRALAGQTLTVTLEAKHPQTYFNVDPAGKEEAMFIGSTSGNTMRRRVPADGDYMVTVYLMRAAARRGSASTYTLSAAVSGQPLAAVSNTKDALVPGTQFHATAMVPCNTSFDPSMTRCAAGVIRRGLDGTATVEVQMHQGVRRVLFAKGKLVASDSAQQLNTIRSGDSIKVRVGNDESFEIADVFLKGD